MRDKVPSDSGRKDVEVRQDKLLRLRALCRVVKTIEARSDLRLTGGRKHDVGVFTAKLGEGQTRFETEWIAVAT
jgi:hypothetical protein